MATSVKIDTSQIPNAVGRTVGKTFYDLIMEFYKDPQNMQEFEEWRRERERSKMATS